MKLDIFVAYHHVTCLLGAALYDFGPGCNFLISLYFVYHI